MKISVALCTYNGARYLREQLDSLAAQTRQPDELVVRDDGSSDDSARIVVEFAKKAPFAVSVSVNEKRLGIAANFGGAIGACTGELIFPCDQDDAWLPGKIEKMAGLFESKPELGMAFGNAEVVKDDLSPAGMTLWDGIQFDANEQKPALSGELLDVLMKHNVVTGATMAFRAKYKPLVLPIPPLPRCVHDGWIAILIAAVADCGIIAEPVIRYRQHGANIIGARKMTLREQAAIGKQMAQEGVFGKDAAVFGAALERLRVMPQYREQLEDYNERKFEMKIRHLRNRDRMSPWMLLRIPSVAREIFSGRYFRCSYGWKSIAQDLFLR